jgi:transposase
MDKITTVGIDLAKNLFPRHEVDERGRVILARTVSPAKVADVIAKLPACPLGVEACSGVQSWARRFAGSGTRCG